MEMSDYRKDALLEAASDILEELDYLRTIPRLAAPGLAEFVILMDVLDRININLSDVQDAVNNVR